MNGKQARNLRKLIREEIPDLPEVSYKRTNKRTKVTLSGNTYETFTLELAGCHRGLYQRAKQLHYQYTGAWYEDR